MLGLIGISLQLQGTVVFKWLVSCDQELPKMLTGLIHSTLQDIMALAAELLLGCPPLTKQTATEQKAQIHRREFLGAPGFWNHRSRSERF